MDTNIPDKGAEDPAPGRIKDPWLSIVVSTDRSHPQDEAPTRTSVEDNDENLTDNEADRNMFASPEPEIKPETETHPETIVEPSTATEVVPEVVIPVAKEEEAEETSSIPDISNIANEINQIKEEQATASLTPTDVGINYRQWWLKTNDDPFLGLDEKSKGDPFNHSLSPVPVYADYEDVIDVNRNLPPIYAPDSPKTLARPPRKSSSLEDYGLTAQEKDDAVAAELSRVKHEQVYHTGDRPAIAETYGVPLEDNPKSRLILIYEGKRTVINWDSSEVYGKSLQEMVIFACDSMNPSGGTDLREVTDVTDLDHVQNRLRTESEGRLGGRMIIVVVDGTRKVYMREKKLGFEDFDQVRDGGTYILEPTLAQKEVDHLVGNRWARVDTEVAAMRHVEVDAAIDRMREGANLLINEDGRTHLRIFQLSEDHDRIAWYSGDQHRDRTYLDIECVSKIVPGCDESYRLHKRVAVFYHLTFTITYSYGHSIFGGQTIKTLTITAKDEDEYDYWILGIKALMFDKRKIKINKRVLLGHSRRFQSAITAGNPSCRPFDMPITVIQNRALNLDSTLSINPLDEARIVAKIKELKIRLDITITDMQKRPDIFIIKAPSKEAPSPSTLNNSPTPSPEEVVEKDRAMEAEKLLSLLDKVDSQLKKMSECVTVQLREARNDEVRWMADRARKANEGILDTEEPPQPYRKLRADLSYKLWECEVDVENSGDIVRRLSRRPSKRTRFMKSFTDFINSVIEPKPPIPAEPHKAVVAPKLVLPTVTRSSPTTHKNNTVITSPITDESASDAWNNLWSSIKGKLLEPDGLNMVAPEKKVELSSDTSRTNTSGVDQSYLHSPMNSYPPSLYAVNTESQNRSPIEIKATPIEVLLNPEIPKPKPRPKIDLLTGEELPPAPKPAPKRQSSIGDLL